jgi:ubiquinone/menaquinone biosynthesis C-methylase UbiE
MNFFAYRSAAERYAKYRPYFHPLVVEKIRAYLQLQGPVAIALDVGCGSGQSTVALKEIAQVVIGMDISEAMLAVAEKAAGIHYVRAAAERLAAKDCSIDLLTTSMAYHWFDREQFFAEARRVLKRRAWLIIFNNGFRGQMHTNPDFEQWVSQVYENEYPTPPRNSVPLTSELAQEHGFEFPHREEYQNEIQYSVEELAAYLTTQSNVIAAAEQGHENVDDVYARLVQQTRPFFKDKKVNFPFSGFIWYLQKAS